TTGNPAGNFVQGTTTFGGDTRAATAVVAYNVLVAVNPAKTADHTAALHVSLALVPDGPAKTAGIATGTAIATATLAFRANDGSSAPSTYSPTGAIGHCAPTPPGSYASALPPGGCAAVGRPDPLGPDLRRPVPAPAAAQHRQHRLCGGLQ